MTYQDPPITRDRAEATLAAVRTQFAPYLEGLADVDQPFLIEPGDTRYGSAGAWFICWEAGPFEWTYHIRGGDGEENELDDDACDSGPCRNPGHVVRSDPTAARVPDGVWAEPYNSFVLSLSDDSPIQLPAVV